MLSGPDGCILDDTLPTKYLAMYQALSYLPPLEPAFPSVDLTEPGKRQWEPSKSGCLNWAVGRLQLNFGDWKWGGFETCIVRC